MTMIDIDTRGITAPFESPASIPAYRAEAVGELRGALILIHEIWGLADHIKDVANRLAAEGYLVIAPDILSNAGVPPEVGAELIRLMSHSDEAERTRAQPLMREKLAPTRSPEYGVWAVAALRRVVDYLELQPGVDGRIGVLGFCFGGSYSFAVAAADRRIRAAIPFYGAPPETADLAALDAPVLALYGADDERLMESLPAVTEKMRDAGAQFLSHVYENAGHAFFNDTNSRSYRPEVAADAWSRTIEFLRGTLAPNSER